MHSYKREGRWGAFILLLGCVSQIENRQIIRSNKAKVKFVKNIISNDSRLVQNRFYFWFPCGIWYLQK